MPQSRSLPTKEKILTYWQKDIGLESNTNICWGCGFECGTQRCHIEPHYINQNDHVSNLVLLCRDCHRKQELICRSESGRKRFRKLIKDNAIFMSSRINSLMAVFEMLSREDRRNLINKEIDKHNMQRIALEEASIAQGMYFISECL